MVVGGPSPSVAWEICNAEADCRVRLKMTSAGSKRNDETFRVTFPKCKSRTVNGTSSSSWSSLKVTVDIWRPSFRHAKRRGTVCGKRFGVRGRFIDEDNGCYFILEFMKYIKYNVAWHFKGIVKFSFLVSIYYYFLKGMILRNVRWEKTRQKFKILF